MENFILKFLWLDKSIALCLDQKVGKFTVPLTEFYFWPQTDAWDDMKSFLESSSFISQDQAIILLNQITEVINYWQEKDVELNDRENFYKKFRSVLFVGYTV